MDTQVKLTVLPSEGGKVMLEGVRVTFKNFAGRGARYNNEGDRNFVLIIDDSNVANRLIGMGWRAKPIFSRNDDGENAEEEPVYWTLHVKINFDSNWPPVVWAVKETGRLQLDANTIVYLDIQTIDYVDVVLSPYDWNHNGNQGRTAYLDQLYAVVLETPLDLKYSGLAEL